MASSNDTRDVSVTSSGVVTGDNPIHHALLLLILQVAIIVCLSRFLALILRPLKQPRVVAEILGGILLGPTGLGNIPGFTNTIFPESSLTVMETIADVGLIFFLFLVGLELNIKNIRKSRVMTMWMAAAGIIFPFGLGTIVSYIICKVLLVDNSCHNFGAFTMFLGVALSITAFPVLARILAERKLLNTEIGQMAMAAAAINDVVAWVLLALAVAITNSKSSPLVALWMLLFGIAFLALMFLVVSPITYALANYNRELPPEPVVAMTLVLVLGAAFLTDLIGVHVIFGAFVCGLIIPKDGPFAGILIEKVEDYVSVLFLPLYFASSGLKTHLSAIENGTAVLILITVLATACIGKVLGTIIVAKVWHLENRKAVALGFLMNTKGLVELIVLNIGLSKGVINEEMFAIMVIMALVTTFITTPVVMWIYTPAREIPPYRRRSIEAAGDEKDALRMLLCPAGSWNIHSMVNIVEITRGKEHKSLRAFVLHLIEYSERLSSIRMSSSFCRREDDSFREESLKLNEVEAAFQDYAQQSNMRVKTAFTVSAFHNMHIDICNTACFNRVNFLILPFHRRQLQSNDGSFETVMSGLKEVNLKVLEDPPCSVGLLVDNGLEHHISSSINPPKNGSQHIYVLFFGGSDDREALMLARRMLQHNGIKLTVIQFVIQGFGCQSVSSHMSLSHSSVAKGVWTGLKCVVDFFKAPWMKTQKSTLRPEQQESSRDSMPNTTSEKQSKKEVHGVQCCLVLPDSFWSLIVVLSFLTCNVAHDKWQVGEDNTDGMLQSERQLDMQALAPILEAAKQNDTCGDNSKKMHKIGSDIGCRNLALRVIETHNLEQSVLEVFHSAKLNELIILGFHAHPHSPVVLSRAFPPVEDLGLGPLGDFLVSKKQFHLRASLLIVKQHKPSKHLSSRYVSPRNLHRVFEEIELGSSFSSAQSEADVSTSNGYHSDGGYSRATKMSIKRALHDLEESLSSP